jgi:pyrimidine deaminase RibD-like protein
MNLIGKNLIELRNDLQIAKNLLIQEEELLENQKKLLNIGEVNHYPAFVISVDRLKANVRKIEAEINKKTGSRFDERKGYVPMPSNQNNYSKVASGVSEFKRMLKTEIDQSTVHHLMRLAIDNGKNSISENGKLSPKVGAAIFKDGKILGFSFRGQFGNGDHAEYTLFERVLKDEDISGATLFTTLEPCTSRGKHTPCSDWIIKKGIKHVYIGLLDPNPKIYNNGCKKLKAAGIEIDYFPRNLREEIAVDNAKFIEQYYANPSLKGRACFNYTNNDGKYIIGNNEFIFETLWSKASDESIHVYNDSASIKTISIADGNNEIREIKDGSIYDGSSRVRTPKINEIVVMENNNGFFVAIKIIDISDKSKPNNDRDELVFEYEILEDRTSNFTTNRDV